MWLISLRDLQWRRRRSLVGVVASSLVLGLALLLAGISASFGNEASRTIRAFRADRWVVATGVNGPFLSSETVPASAAPLVAHLPGVVRAEPVAILALPIGAGTRRDANLIGVAVGGLAEPPVVDGRALRRGEMLADRRMHLRLGASVTVRDRQFRVVGHTDGLSYRAGVATGYLTLADAEEVGYAGLPLAGAVITQGTPRSLPPGLTALRPAQVRSSLLIVLRNATKTIDLIEVLLWLVAAMIVGSVIYISALDRVRDFAVLKATGAGNRFLFGGLAIQAAAIVGAAYVAGIVVSRLLTPLSPMRAEIPPGAYGLLLLVSSGVALLASLVGLSRVARVDPALAFGAA